MYKNLTKEEVEEFEEKFVNRNGNFNTKSSMEAVKSFIDQLIGKRMEEVKKIKYKINVDEYLPMVQAWDEKNFDVPFDHGYNQAKKDILQTLTNKE